MGPSLSNREYHERRADDELLHAKEAASATAARIHRELAAMHRRKLLSIVEEGRADVVELRAANTAA